MQDGGIDNPALMVPLSLEERNKRAQSVIDEYASKHTGMDLALGVVGIIPGAAIPAMMVALAAQAPVIYQPLARKLAKVYLAPPEELGDAQSYIVPARFGETVVLDLSADFGVSFMKHIAADILPELGLGTLATLVPVIGGIVAAGLDVAIAQKMTNRVGRMVSIYYQNGAAWRESKAGTYEAAKNMVGDLSSIRRTMSDVKSSLVKNVRTFVEMMSKYMSKDQIRDALRSRDVPDDLIDAALQTA